MCSESGDSLSRFFSGLRSTLVMLLNFYQSEFEKHPFIIKYKKILKLLL